jgi:hypothetical protein
MTESRNPTLSLKLELTFIYFLCSVAIMVPIFAFFSYLKPTYESMGSWFQRSGAITSIFAIFCQLRVNNFLEKIRGTTFAESWTMFNLFKRPLSIINYVVIIIAICGALVWGYGDLCVKCCK